MSLPPLVALPPQLQSLADRARQAFLERGDVVDALGQHARQFLQAREAVEFERIELALAQRSRARLSTN